MVGGVGLGLIEPSVGVVLHWSEVNKVRIGGDFNKVGLIWGQI